MSEQPIPYPAVDDPSQLPEDAPIGAVAPVGRDQAWIKLARGWMPGHPLLVDALDDLCDDLPAGTQAVVRVMPGVTSYYIKVEDGWVVDGEAERANNWSPERRIEWKLDRLLELLSTPTSPKEGQRYIDESTGETKEYRAGEWKGEV